MVNGVEADYQYARVRNPSNPIFHIFQDQVSYLPLSLSVTHCLDPPTPPTQNNLTLQDWDATTSKSEWNAKINYTCNAGGHNAFVSDFWQDLYELTCQDDNTFETPTWPTCVSSRLCKNSLNLSNNSLLSKILPKSIWLWKWGDQMHNGNHKILSSGFFTKEKLSGSFQHRVPGGNKVGCNQFKISSPYFKVEM